MSINKKKAYLAGGCFWGLEELFKKMEGVIDTEVGYMGGTELNPTYEKHTGHAEAIEITYDSNKISFEDLLKYFFRVHDPTTKNRQKNDIGSSYRSAIFYQNEDEKLIAIKVIKMVNKSGKWLRPVVTTLEKKDFFFKAESYHQDYLQKNPKGYTCHLEYFKSY